MSVFVVRDSFKAGRRQILKNIFPVSKYRKETPETTAEKCRHDLTDLYTKMLDDSYRMGEEHAILQYKIVI